MYLNSKSDGERVKIAAVVLVAVIFLGGLLIKNEIHVICFSGRKLLQTLILLLLKRGVIIKMGGRRDD